MSTTLSLVCILSTSSSDLMCQTLRSTWTNMSYYLLLIGNGYISCFSGFVDQLILKPLPLFDQTWSKPSSSAPTSMKAPKCLTPVTCQHWKMIGSLDASFHGADVVWSLLQPLFTQMWSTPIALVTGFLQLSNCLKLSFGFQQLRENPWPDPAILLLKKKKAHQPGNWTKVSRRWTSQNTVDASEIL